MKKYLCFLFTILLLKPFNNFAINIEIAEPAEVRKLIIDLTLSRIVERKMENDTADSNKIVDSNEGYVKISYTIFDFLQPYAKIGATKFEEELKKKNISGFGLRDLELEYDWDLSYGGGVCGRIPLIADLFIGYDAQYTKSENELKNVIHNAENAINEEGKGRFSQWHLATYLGKDFISDSLKITPYIGARYSDIRFKIVDDFSYTVNEGRVSYSDSTKAEDNIGGFVGLGLKFYDKFRLNLQGRFLNETAFSLSGGVEF